MQIWLICSDSAHICFAWLCLSSFACWQLGHADLLGMIVQRLLECACLGGSLQGGNLAGQNTIERHVREDPTWFPVLLWDGLVAGPIRASPYLTSNQYTLQTSQPLECPGRDISSSNDAQLHHQNTLNCYFEVICAV